jgi:hypothetical protein
MGTYHDVELQTFVIAITLVLAFYGVGLCVGFLENNLRERERIPMQPAHKILLIYSYAPESMRPTIAEHLYSFKKYSPYPVTYVNLARQPLPLLRELHQFDLVILHYLFMANHWSGPEWMRQLMRRVSSVLRINAVKVALVQDEFYYPDIYCTIINEFGINCVFGVAPESEWPKIYRSVDFTKVHFFSALTGYVDDDVARKPKIVAPLPKTIDIGYRTSGKPYFWFGRHGYLKQQIADAVLKLGPEFDLSIDISTSGEDTIQGDDWYDFLVRCKYTIGVESGTSIVDHDGSVHKRTTEFVRAHPDATFAQVEAACFPGRDGEINLFALGPRHLEACMTKTCQILTEGRYNDVLRPWDHYIPVKKDLSNLGEVLEIVKKDTLRKDICERAFHDIVASGRYSYKGFVENVIATSLKYRDKKNASYWNYVLRDSLRLAGQGARVVPGKAKGLIKRIARKILAR